MRNNSKHRGKKEGPPSEMEVRGLCKNPIRCPDISVLGKTKGELKEKDLVKEEVFFFFSSWKREGDNPTRRNWPSLRSKVTGDVRGEPTG